MKNLIKYFLINIFILTAAAFANNTDNINSKISDEQLKPLDAWINRTTDYLYRSQQAISQMPEPEQIKASIVVINEVLSRSIQNQFPNSEFFMRNFLYRAIEIYNDVLSKDLNTYRGQSFARWYLKWTIEQAFKFGLDDAKRLKDNSFLNFGISKERMYLGLYWANVVVGNSFDIGSNRSRYLILQKVMGFLFQDIINDDRHSRTLAGSGEQIVLKHKVLIGNTPTNNLEFLFESRKLRDFLVKEIAFIQTKIATPNLSGHYILNSQSNSSPYDLTMELCINMEKVYGSVYTAGCLNYANKFKENSYGFSEVLLNMCTRLLYFGNVPAFECLAKIGNREIDTVVPKDFVESYMDLFIRLQHSKESEMNVYKYGQKFFNIGVIINKNDFSNYLNEIENCKKAAQSGALTIFLKCISEE